MVGVLGSRSATSRPGRVSATSTQVVVWSALTAAMLSYATPLAFAAMGGLFSERKRRREHRPQGMMLAGAFSASSAPTRLNSWALGLSVRGHWREEGSRSSTRSSRSICARIGRSWAAFAINFLALGITGLSVHRHLRRRGNAAGHLRDSRRPPQLPVGLVLHRACARPAQPDDLARCADRPSHLGRDVQDADRAADPRRRRASSCRGHASGSTVYKIRYASVVLSGILAALGRRLPLDRVRELVHAEHDGRARVHRPRRGHLRQLAPVRRRRGVPSLRLLERPRPAAAAVLGFGRRSLPGALRTCSP